MSETAGLPVRDVTDDVVSIPASASLDQVAETMYAEAVGFVVVTENGEAAGVLTDRDMALSLREQPIPESTTAADLVTAEPVTIDRDMDVLRVLEKMKLEEVRRVVVLDGDGDPEGVVSLDDVLVLLGEEMGDVADLLEAQT